MIPAGKDDKESQKKEAGHLRDTFWNGPLLRVKVAILSLSLKDSALSRRQTVRDRVL